MWELVPPDEREALRAAAYALLEPARAPDGSIRFDPQIRYTLGEAPGRA